jgi:CheY-like chemotaxis protein
MSKMSEPIPSKRRVIVVDDERLIANTLAIILNNAGYDARAVFSGEQLVELLESFQPEVLIADVVMPGITGIEAAIATRNKFPKCNILLFSGQAITEDLMEQARTQGHEFELLAKPVHPSELLAMLHLSNIFYS